MHTLSVSGKILLIAAIAASALFIVASISHAQEATGDTAVTDTSSPVVTDTSAPADTSTDTSVSTTDTETSTDDSISNTDTSTDTSVSDSDTSTDSSLSSTDTDTSAVTADDTTVTDTPSDTSDSSTASSDTETVSDSSTTDSPDAQAPPAPAPLVVSEVEPELSTDKPDYYPGQTASIFGRFFQSLQNIVLHIFGDSEPSGDYADDYATVTTDETGSFTYQYQLDNVFRPLYTVTAQSTDGTLLAQTTFTDAPTKINLEQCHNFDGAFVDCTDLAGPTNYWGGGNAQSSNAQMNEGDSQNYRIVITNLTPGTYTLVIEQDLTKGGKMAQDFWTGPGNIKTAADTTSPYNTAAGVNPCIDGGNATAYCTNGSGVTNISIPSLSTSTTAGLLPDFQAVIDAQTAFSSTNTISPTPGMHIYGATGSITNYTFSGDFATGDSAIQGTITFTNTLPTVVIAYGGHISAAADYAGIPKLTATGISGSPYHNRLISFTGINGDTGNQDMQMASTALLPQGAELTLLKEVINDNGGTAVDTNWTLTATGPTPISGAEGNAAVTNAAVDAGSYTLGENGGPTGYTASTYSCVVNGGAPVVSNSLTLADSDVAICTITNDDDAPSLTLVKTVINDNGGTAVAANWTLSAAGYDALSPDAGTYNLSESGPSNYTQTSLTCDNAVGQVTDVTLGLGEDVTCTFVNDDVSPILTIVKDADPNDLIDFSFNGTGIIGAFQLDDDAAVLGADAILSNSKTFNNLQAGQNYTVTETLPNTFWTFVGATCVVTNTATPYPMTPTTNGVTVNLGLADDVTCTITNHKDSPTRTQGFWQTHTAYTSSVFTNPLGLNSSMLIGDGATHKGPVETIGKVFGAFYSSIPKKTDKSNRTALDKARMQLLQQLVAAKLNCAAFGCASSVSTLIIGADNAYALGTSTASVLAYAGALDAYNNSGDTIIISPPLPVPGPATPKTSKANADLGFWDTP